MSDAGGGASWAAELRTQVAEASAQMLSTFANVASGRRKVARQLDRIVEKVGAADSRQPPVGGDLHRRVLDSFAGRTFAVLSVRERRYAARQLEHVPAAAMQALLAAYPSNWSAFATECFRRWETFQRLPERANYTRLLCVAPPSVAFLHVTGRPQDLLTDDGVTVVAHRLRGVELRQARMELQRLGFEPSWQFSAISMAMWVRTQVVHGAASFAALWQALSRELIDEAMLLPPLRESSRSWFSATARPARVRGAVQAHAVIVTSLIRVAMQSGADAHWGDFAEKLLASELGDPRIPPESTGWQLARKFDDEACRRFFELLITEDLSVFFEHAMIDRRRKSFWLRYVSSVRRTLCILDRSTHARLTRQLAGSDKRLSAAMARALRFTTNGGGSSAQAFCLYFDHFVVVEFSETGNAAYIYDRAVFERHFQGAVEQNGCSNHAQLKNTKLRSGRIVHSDHGWEDLAKQTLAALKIYPR